MVNKIKEFIWCNWAYNRLLPGIDIVFSDSVAVGFGTIVGSRVVVVVASAVGEILVGVSKRLKNKRRSKLNTIGNRQLYFA